MNEYEKITLLLNDVLSRINLSNSKEEQQKILSMNIEIFKNFQMYLSSILRLYQFKKEGDISQNYISDKLNEDIVMILKQKSLLENQLQLNYFLPDLLDALNYNENRMAFNLQYEKNIKNVEIAIAHLVTRNEYLKILEENEYFQDEKLVGVSALKYSNNRYEENMLGHSMIQIKNNLLKINKEDIIRIINYIDDSRILSRFTKNINNYTDFYVKNFILQYIDTILKLKSIFTPETIENDELVQAMCYGKINDVNLIQSIMKNIKTDVLDVLLNLSKEEQEDSYISNLASHLKNIGHSDQSIATIIEEVLDKEISLYCVAELLVEIDMPDDFDELINSKDFKEYSWIAEKNVFKKLKELESQIENAQTPYLPVEYYVKKLKLKAYVSNIDRHFIQNLITALKSNFYTKFEKEILKKALKANNFANLYNTYRGKYKKIDSLETTIPIIKNLMQSSKIDDNISNRILLEICIENIINDKLAEKGIYIENKVFWGYDEIDGYYENDTNSIWINSDLIDEFINAEGIEDKVELFKTIFHEMQHAVQQYNINHDNIDYLTYNMIKENLIEEYDNEYYESNYDTIYTESDARKEEIIETLTFLKQLDEKFVEAISDKEEASYIEEASNHTIYGDSNKKIKMGKKSTSIDISNYVGYLIQNNLRILIENPILEIEYNQDGTKKDLETLLTEFRQGKFEGLTKHSNIYSIYYGLILKEIEKSPNENPEVKKQISEFLEEQDEFISLADMQNLYKKVPPTRSHEVYSKLFSLTRNFNKSVRADEEKGAEFNDDDQR